jgi:hypothetical protein
LNGSVHSPMVRIFTRQRGPVRKRRALIIRQDRNQLFVR